MTKKLVKTPGNVASGRPLLNSIYSVKIPAKRVLLMCLAELNKRPESEKDNRVFEITATAYREVFEVNETNARKEVKAAVKELHDSNVIFQQDGKYGVKEVKWLHAVEHSGERTPKAAHRITIHEDVMPFLRDLESGFAKFALADVKGLSSVNQIRLYEDLMLYRTSATKSWTTSIDDLAVRYQFGPSIVQRAFHFKAKFLDKAIAAINESTPLQVSYVANGRDIKFFIETKSGE